MEIKEHLFKEKIYIFVISRSNESKTFISKIILNECGVFEVGLELELQLQPSRKEAPNTCSPRH